MRLFVTVAFVLCASAQTSVDQAHARGQRALQEKHYAEAAAAFDEALAAANPSNRTLLAGLHYFKGAALGMDGKILPALTSAELAVRYVPQESAYRKLRDRLRQQASQTVIPAEQITRALLTARSFDVEGASVDLWVNYDLNQDSLSATGVEQARQLGVSLSDASFAKAKFHLIGHTDSRGTDAYNQDLSERRASKLARYISANYGITAARLTAEGHGEREPKAEGENEEAWSVNRRVEVRIVE